MQFIGARLRYAPNCRCGSMLGIDSAGFDFELLQGIRKRQRHIRAGHKINVTGSIQRVIDRITERAANLYVRFRRTVLRPACRRLHRCSGKRNQVADLASIEGQFQDSLVLDNLTDTGVTRFHHGSVRLNLDLLRNLSHFQHGIDHRAAINLQDDSSLHKRSKSRQCCFQFVRTDRQIRKHIGTRLVRDCISSNSRICLRHRNLDAG